MNTLCTGLTKPFMWGGLAASSALVIRMQALPDTALGRYFICRPADQQPESKPCEAFTWLYPQPTIEQARLSPYWNLSKGYLWDLACKVLAATTFYQTSAYSSVTAIVTFLPTCLKDTRVAQTLLQGANSPRVNNHFLFTSHLAAFAPVVMKVIHIVLETISLHTDGKRPYVESWKNRVQKISTQLEAFWFARFALVACGNTLGPYSTLSLAVLQTVLVNIFGSGCISPMMKELFMPSCVTAGLVSCTNSFFYSDSVQLKNLQEISMDNWSSKQCWEKLISLSEDLQALVFPSHIQQFHSVVEKKATADLESRIYPQLCSGQFDAMEQKESDLREIYWSKGKAKIFYKDQTTHQLECIRFSLMFLFANLTRLYKKRTADGLTEDQYSNAQELLYLQTLQSIQGDIYEDDITCFNVGDVIARLCAEQHRAKAKLPQDPFFQPLRTMLGLLSEQNLAGMNPKLGRLIISLSLCIDSEEGVSQLNSRIVKFNEQRKLSEGSLLFIQDQVSKVSESVTWSLDQILGKAGVL